MNNMTNTNQATMIGSGGQMIGSGGQTAQKNLGERFPDLEILGADFHTIAGNLMATADMLEGRLANFLSEPSSLNKPTQTVQPAEPPPGTLGSLELARTRLRDQSARLAQMVDKLKGIL